jgi:hypothetical protein
MSYFEVFEELLDPHSVEGYTKGSDFIEALLLLQSSEA